MTPAELAGRIGARLHGDSAALLNGVNTVECATPEEVTFVTTQAHTDGVRQSKAGAVIVAESRTDVPMPQLVVDCVDRAFIETLKLLPEAQASGGIHPRRHRRHRRHRAGRRGRAGRLCRSGRADRLKLQYRAGLHDRREHFHWLALPP